MKSSWRNHSPHDSSEGSHEDDGHDSNVYPVGSDSQEDHNYNSYVHTAEHYESTSQSQGINSESYGAEGQREEYHAEYNHNEHYPVEPDYYAQTHQPKHDVYSLHRRSEIMEHNVALGLEVAEYCDKIGFSPGKVRLANFCYRVGLSAISISLCRHITSA
jgi:hypothetical protein